MIHKQHILLVIVILTAIFCCWETTSIDEQTSSIHDKDEGVKLLDKRDGKHLNYLRLADGECHNCSTYKCTSHKANMGGSEWCIMLFPDALSHCDSDSNCGGYTMTTAKWFHTKYDKNGQVAVHLTKVGEKPFNCSFSEWSSYEKQKSIRHTPVVYGRTTCENRCDKTSNFNYVFESNSNAVQSAEPYLCNDHPNKLDKRDANCILPIADGIKLCNEDHQCQGFLINTDDNWQKKFVHNSMQAVQLFGQGVTLTPSETWRTFKKQH